MESLLSRTLPNHSVGNHSPPQTHYPHSCPFPMVFITIRPILCLTHCSLLFSPTQRPREWEFLSTLFTAVSLGPYQCSAFVGAQYTSGEWRNEGMGNGMSEDKECTEGCAQHMTDAQVSTCLFCCLNQKPRDLLDMSLLLWANAATAMPTIQAIGQSPTCPGSINKN